MKTVKLRAGMHAKLPWQSYSRYLHFTAQSHSHCAAGTFDAPFLFFQRHSRNANTNLSWRLLGHATNAQAAHAETRVPVGRALVIGALELACCFLFFLGIDDSPLELSLSDVLRSFDSSSESYRSRSLVAISDVCNDEELLSVVSLSLSGVGADPEARATSARGSGASGSGAGLVGTYSGSLSGAGSGGGASGSAAAFSLGGKPEGFFLAFATFFAPLAASFLPRCNNSAKIALITSGVSPNFSFNASNKHASFSCWRVGSFNLSSEKIKLRILGSTPALHLVLDCETFLINPAPTGVEMKEANLHPWFGLTHSRARHSLGPNQLTWFVPRLGQLEMHSEC